MSRSSSHPPHRPAQEVVDAWERGFAQKNGHELQQAMSESSDALQEFMDGVPANQIIAPEGNLVIGCIEDRLEGLPRHGIAGCGILVTDSFGNVRVPTVSEMAHNIAHAPSVESSDAPIELWSHDNCGACAMAAKSLGMYPEQGDSLGRELVEEVADRLQHGYARAGVDRDVTFHHANMGSAEMPGPASGHPGQVIYVADGVVLDPQNPHIPQGMQIDPGVFAEERDFGAHLRTGAGILSNHGPGQSPILIVGLTSEEGGADYLQQRIDAQLDGFDLDVLARSAELRRRE